MEFYKILKMDPHKDIIIYNLFEMMSCNYIKGNYNNSFAIRYNPESYNKLLYNEYIFDSFQKYSIQQLFVTNQKYIALLNNKNKFNMDIIDCLFEEDFDSLYLDETDEPTINKIPYIVDTYNFNIKEMTFITEDRGKQIILQKNGVIGIDSGLTDDEKRQLTRLIDTLNFGLKVIKK